MCNSTISPILFWLRSTVVSVHHPYGSLSSSTIAATGTVATTNGASSNTNPNKPKIRLWLINRLTCNSGENYTV